jgi:hypothetical protein
MRINPFLIVLFLISTALLGYYFFINKEYQNQRTIPQVPHLPHAVDIGDVYQAEAKEPTKTFLSVHQLDDPTIPIEPTEPEVFHISPPDRVRAIYMSSWVGGTKTFRNELIDFMIQSDINAVVLDIKDYSGVIAFPVDDPNVNVYDTDSNRIPDIKELIQKLHDNNIYIIGRITLFQDPLLSEKAPHLAFKRKDNGAVWKDKKGLAFINPKHTESLEYFSGIAEYAYSLGFDEINFDYIRFPSDGDISNLDYELLPQEKKTDVMKDVYLFLDENLRSKGIPISADLFGMTTINTDDLSIGQYLEDALLHFDYVAPMVYPSHYPNGFKGYANPAQYPYEIVYDAMTNAVQRATAMGLSGDNLRTWIQDFDLGANYDTTKIHAQIRASYDAGVDSYMVWDPRNIYTKEAYIKDLTYTHDYE